MSKVDKTIEHLGETSGAADHDHDMIHELSKRLDTLWRLDQYIANAKKHKKLAKFWKDLRIQETANISKLKTFIRKHLEKDCF